jgi:hypothetical protein
MTTTETPPVDTAALAAKDDTNVPSVGDHLAAAAQAVTEQTAPATGEPMTEIQMEVQPDGTATGTADNTPPEIPSQREADLQRRVNVLEERLRYFTERREKEQHLLSQRDSALAAIEGAKARVQSCKGELAEVEEEIAALLKEPMPMTFEATPIGQAIAAAEGEASAAAEAPPVPAWESILPAVSPDAVKLLDDAAGDELPTVDALCGALLAPQAMMGGKRVVKQSVQVYGTPWIVTHLWKDEATGACRANVVRLYTKDEYQQTHEAKYGRAVGDFDQSDEAKAQRQVGGEWCGLVVKVGRKVYVVGPQADALHLAYLPPEPAETITDDQHERAMAAADAGETGDDDLLTVECVVARLKRAIAASGKTAAAYGNENDLPYVPLSNLLASGVVGGDAEAYGLIYDHAVTLGDEIEEGDQHMGPGIPA